MELLTKEHVLDMVAQLWDQQYKFAPADSHKGIICEKLSAGNLTEQQINELIGNDSWTRLDCDECGEPVEAVIQFSDQHGEDHINVCFKCLSAAIKMTE